ncbi:hypothetical protein KSX_79020 [Ktedonospora formicarum]|uniref:Uncharacterized protein n=1 Tax=Ktedonospora formicarum TaxID=2778364 RepID=A0A8J3I571_9CHLR|nr:hypothetical protein KSX_79020 [Ktedonospora formicarum]
MANSFRDWEWNMTQAMGLASPSVLLKEVHLNETSGQLISRFLLSLPRGLNVLTHGELCTG